MANTITLDPHDPRLDRAREVYYKASEALLAWRQANAERKAARKADPYDPARAHAANEAEGAAFDSRMAWEVAFMNVKFSTQAKMETEGRIDWAALTDAWAEPYRARMRQD